MSSSSVTFEDIMTFSTSLNIAEIYGQAVDQLAKAGVPEADVDAEVLLGFVLGVGRGEVVAKVMTESSITSDKAEKYAELIGRRAQREPLQYITGVAWFRSLTLEVGTGVFVPRPETELLAGMAVDALRSQVDPAPIAVDLGTGSGAIALAIATEVPHAQVFAVEKSSDALVWTKKNFESHVGTNAHLIHGDLAGDELLNAFPHLEGAVSVIVSNPPYIPTGAIPRDPEVQLFDPHLALYGGEDGLDIIRQLSHVALRLGRPGAVLMIEHGELQGEEIRNILSRDGWLATATYKDLVGRERYTTGLRP